MKTLYATIFTLFALGVGFASAEEITQPQSDTIMLSESVDGDYLVRRYLVRHNDSEAQYQLKYSISASRLTNLIAGNAEELAALDKFMAEIKQDTSIHVQRIEIVGYASPDGNLRNNETLAMSRAQKFRALIDSRFDASMAYKVQLSSAVEPWQACDGGVEASTLGDKQKALEILNSSETPQAKEAQLKQMPAVWQMLRAEVLPPLRRVDMTIFYNIDTVVELRTLIKKPEPQVEPVAQKKCCCPVVVEDEMIGIIVDMKPPKHHHHHGHQKGGAR